MVADDTPGGSAEGAMMTSKMASSAAYQGSLDASLGIGRSRDGQKRKRSNRARECLVHFSFSQLLAKRVVLKQLSYRKVPVCGASPQGQTCPPMYAADGTRGDDSSREWPVRRRHGR
jgi:hypothetical protein